MNNQHFSQRVKVTCVLPKLFRQRAQGDTSPYSPGPACPALPAVAVLTPTSISYITEQTNLSTIGLDLHCIKTG